MSLRAMRVAAIVLAIVPGLGTGHLVLGRTRRALVWFAAPAALMTLIWAFFPLLARTIGLRSAVALAIALGGVLLVAGPLDAARVRPGSTRAPKTVVLAIYAALALASTFALRAMAASAFEVRMVPSMAMAPTLAPGDRVAVDRRKRSAPARGDVLLFAHPKTEAPFLGRVVGLPGERVEVARGRVRVDGKPLRVCPVAKDVALVDPPTPLDRGELFVEGDGNASYLAFVSEADSDAPARSFEVPAGSVFVLGDHRSRSEDSREFGPIAIERALGTAAYYAGRTSASDAAGLTFGAKLDHAQPTQMTALHAPAIRGCAVGAPIPPALAADVRAPR
ncbi:MAG: signal peptidase I [Myxococcales bacterium]|nr:signal peptidase I [Myxococcales bacterium]